jgi:hypothetical protein
MNTEPYMQFSLLHIFQLLTYLKNWWRTLLPSGTPARQRYSPRFARTRPSEEHGPVTSKTPWCLFEGSWSIKHRDTGIPLGLGLACGQATIICREIRSVPKRRRGPSGVHTGTVGRCVPLLDGYSVQIGSPGRGLQSTAASEVLRIQSGIRFMLFRRSLPPCRKGKQQVGQ